MSILPPIEERLARLLALTAHEVRPCKTCGKPLYFVRLNTAGVVPYSADGINHVLQCQVASPEERMTHILEKLACEIRPCKACGSALYFVRHKNNKSAPYTADGVNHFLACSAAESFRRKKKPEVNQ